MRTYYAGFFFVAVSIITGFTKILSTCEYVYRLKHKKLIVFLLHITSKQKSNCTHLHVKYD